MLNAWLRIILCGRLTDGNPCLNDQFEDLKHVGKMMDVLEDIKSINIAIGRKQHRIETVGRKWFSKSEPYMGCSAEEEEEGVGGGGGGEEEGGGGEEEGEEGGGGREGGGEEEEEGGGGEEEGEEEGGGGGEEEEEEEEEEGGGGVGDDDDDQCPSTLRLIVPFLEIY